MADKHTDRMIDDHNKIQTAEVVLLCTNLEQSLTFYTDELGFRIDTIFPADAPHTAVISAYGVRLCLCMDSQDRPRQKPQDDIQLDPLRLRLHHSGSSHKTLISPDGVVIEFISNQEILSIPKGKGSFVHTKFDTHSQWHRGRAAMGYRDLIPDRQGGRFIASHIHIPDAGPVADYVHFHKVRFQMIFCYKGWVKLVYEDQGAEFILRSGDAVLQPPQIRHRVLECSENLEVIEITCPAEHETHTDHQLDLPNTSINPEREFEGQVFTRHQSEMAIWGDWRVDGFEARDLGIGRATQGLAGAYVVRGSGEITPKTHTPDEEFLMFFILSGQLNLTSAAEGDISLSTGDTCVLPRNFAHSFVSCSSDFEMLEVRFSDQ